MTNTQNDANSLETTGAPLIDTPTESRLIDVLGGDCFYNAGLKGRPRPSGVEDGSVADIEWQQGLYCFLNNNKKPEDIQPFVLQTV